MTRFAVAFTTDARAQILAVGRWWRVNRPVKPTLFLTELRAALNRLVEAPRAGAPYAAPRTSGVRRLLLPRTGYYVYYTVDDSDSIVHIVAIWHTARGGGPVF